MSTLIPLICPRCGSQLMVNSDVSQYFHCEFCGLTSVIKDAIVQNYITNVALNVTAEKDFSIRGGVLESFNGEGVDVVIPNNVKRIGYNAFQGLSIESVTIPPSVTTIDALPNCFINGAFRGCSSLKKVVFSEGLKEIGECSFQSCTSLKELNLPNGLETIGALAFSSCSSLKEIEFPYGLKTIQGMAFAECKSLSKITIPSTVSEIGYRAFSDCVNLREVVYKGDPANIRFPSGKGLIFNCSENYCAFNNTLYKFETQERWIKQNRCILCGSQYSGVLKPKCIKCGFLKSNVKYHM